jgi:DNA-binding transcriptional LysR family regulator
MLDGVSLDQLRTFIAIADEGSFSAAGRRLRRAQSVVSQTLANLEKEFRVKLFERRGRLPVLTDQGRALLADARALAGDVDCLKVRAKRLAGGLEPELSVAVDVMFPDAAFAAAVTAFQKQFPATLVHFDIESSAVIEPLLDGRCAVGVVGSWALAPPQLSYEPLLTIRAPTVVSARHTLAKYRGSVPTRILAEHILLTHINSSDLSRGYSELRIRLPKVWRLAHLEVKLAFLRAGFGFGCMPMHMVEADLASGALVQITIEDEPPAGREIAMSAVYRSDSPLGPAGRWFVDRLKLEQEPLIKGTPPRSASVTASAKPRRRRSPNRAQVSKRKPSR